MSGNKVGIALTDGTIEVKQAEAMVTEITLSSELLEIYKQNVPEDKRVCDVFGTITSDKIPNILRNLIPMRRNGENVIDTDTFGALVESWLFKCN